MGLGSAGRDAATSQIRIIASAISHSSRPELRAAKWTQRSSGIAPGVRGRSPAPPETSPSSITLRNPASPQSFQMRKMKKRKGRRKKEGMERIRRPSRRSASALSSAKCGELARVLGSGRRDCAPSLSPSKRVHRQALFSYVPRHSFWFGEALPPSSSPSRSKFSASSAPPHESKK